MSRRMDTTLISVALEKALASHRPKPGLLLHSDRGSQYCSHEYQKKASRYKIHYSMSRKGDCYDNAPMESFWGLLKNELVHHRRFHSVEEACRAISEYIDIFYNRIRRQAGLGYLSPAQFAQRAAQEATRLPA